MRKAKEVKLNKHWTATVLKSRILIGCQHLTRKRLQLLINLVTHVSKMPKEVYKALGLQYYEVDLFDNGEGYIASVTAKGLVYNGDVFSLALLKSLQKQMK